MRAALLALLVGCAPAAMPMNAQHPAHPDASTGRLAGPPAALRPGVADISTPARASTPTDHSGHGPKPPTADHWGHGASPQTPATDRSGHQHEPAGTEPETEPAKTEPAKTEPAKTKPRTPPKTKPAEKPRKQDTPPASKTTPGTEPPKQPPPAHHGHEGHH